MGGDPGRVADVVCLDGIQARGHEIRHGVVPIV
jgi:hypothetical protein